MHEQPNGKGDIEPSFNHTGVHNCNWKVVVRIELGSLVTEVDLKGCIKNTLDYEAIKIMEIVT